MRVFTSISVLPSGYGRR